MNICLTRWWDESLQAWWSRRWSVGHDTRPGATRPWAPDGTPRGPSGATDTRSAACSAPPAARAPWRAETCSGNSLWGKDTSGQTSLRDVGVQERLQDFIYSIYSIYSHVKNWTMQEVFIFLSMFSIHVTITHFYRLFRPSDRWEQRFAWAERMRL